MAPSANTTVRLLNFGKVQTGPKPATSQTTRREQRPVPPGPRDEQPAPETNMDKNLRRKKSLTEIPFVQSWYEQHKYVSSPTYEMKEIDRKYHRYKILVSNQIKSNRIKSSLNLKENPTKFIISFKTFLDA